MSVMMTTDMRSRRTTDPYAGENSQTPAPRLPILAVTVTAPPRIPRAVASLIQGHFDCPWQTGATSIARPSRMVRELRMFFPPQILGASMSRVPEKLFPDAETSPGGESHSPFQSTDRSG